MDGYNSHNSKPNKSFRKIFWNYLTTSNFGILKKFLVTFFIISVFPLFIFGLYTLITISTTGKEIETQIMKNIDDKTKETIEFQALLISNSVEKFLKQREGDLYSLLKLNPSLANYLLFSKQHESEIWIRGGTNENPYELHILIPLYREISFVAADGQEMIKISEAEIVPNHLLKNVSNPQNTTYKSEEYFKETIKLKENEIYVSHLTGFYVNKLEQLGNAKKVEDAIEGKEYEGVIRFTTPVYKDGKLNGIVVLGLDHRHLMDMTQHILPNQNTFTVFPSYSSGDYAFMFDDEGWIITHPKFWDIRGVDKKGNLIPAYTLETPKSKVDSGITPFNLDKAGFIHKNYPYVSNHVRQKQAGSVTTINVGGTEKLMAYAPVLYDKGVYKKYGIFGGITLGSELEKFHTPALSIADELQQTVKLLSKNISWFILFTLIISVVISWFISRSLSKPIIQITNGARLMARGELDNKIDVSRNDEIGYLANSFNYMAEEIKRKNLELMKSFDELKRSKNEIENYAGDLEYQVKIFKSILRISNTLGSAFDLNRVLKYILHNSVASLGFDRAILYLVDEKEKYLVCREVYGFNKEEEDLARNSKYNIHHSDCIETKVVKNGNIIFVDDINKYPEATDLDKKIRRISGSKSFVFAPLRIRERTIGILGADKLRSKTNISELDVSSLQILANQASRVIESTRLVQEIIVQRNFNEDILKFMPDGVITVDKDGRINSINPAADNILETETQDIIGKSIWELFGYDHSIIEEIGNSIRLNGVYRRYNQDLFVNDKTKFITITASPMNNPDSEKSGTIVILQNTTEKKLLDDQIQKMDRLASLGKFAAGIAHEIRNPLTGLSLFLDDLHDKSNNQPGISKYIEMGLSEVERLESFVNELLDYSSPAKQKSSSKNINFLIEATLNFIDKQCRNSNIMVRTELSADIPEVYIDQEKIRQALLNILLNAIHAMPDGGQLKIKTSYIKNKREDFLLNSGNGNNKAGWVMIKISDTGSGIPDSIINKIFDPFFTNKKGGTGLGLSITQNIIAEHKGRIKVSNSHYGGAVFAVYFPVAAIMKKELLVKEI